MSFRLTAILAFCAGAMLQTSNPAFGQSVTILHRFSNVPAQPTGLILASDGNLYGTSAKFRPQASTDLVSRGTVFRLTPGGVETTLYSFGLNSNFAGSALDGDDPQAPLIEGSDGNFYGTTYAGGAHDRGTVFKITPFGELTTLYSFGATDDDGGHPRAALIRDGEGNLYGTTFDGGAKLAGTVFRILPSGYEEILHSFGTVPHDGTAPLTPLVRRSDGALYGTTFNGGRYGKGTIYKISPEGVESVLYSFGTKPNDGARPGALVAGSGELLFGITTYGRGTFFEITSDGVPTVLYQFGTNLDDSQPPIGTLSQGPDGSYYGGEVNGDVFKITPNGNCSRIGNGGGPLAPILAVDGEGTVFGVTGDAIARPVEVTDEFAFFLTGDGVATPIYVFGTNRSEGTMPRAPVIQGTDGDFYGTTSYGGANGAGTIFKATAAGIVTVLHSFQGFPSDGASPRAALIQAADGDFYGTTSNGGSLDEGTAFKVTAAGAETVLHSFATKLTDGWVPLGPLIQAQDGNLYGTTSEGGIVNQGTVFKVTTAGVESVIYNFGENAGDCIYPLAGLLQGRDGNLYGTAFSGGAGLYGGAIFKITSSGNESQLYSFPNGVEDGVYPESPLVQDESGDFYGTTIGSSSHSNGGTIFKVTASGTETILFDFGSAAFETVGPAGLTKGNDGNLYGASSSTLFRISPVGVRTVLYRFAENPDGAAPMGLVLATDGKFYGTTRYGGNDAGTFFKFDPASSSPPVAHDDAVAIIDGRPVEIDVVANDTDLNHLRLTISSVSEPSLGRARIDSQRNLIIYTPNQNFRKFSGVDSFTYTINNENGSAATARVIVGNRFYFQKGTYNGILTSPGGGTLTITISSGGTFTGKLKIGAKTTRLSGVFDSDGNFLHTYDDISGGLKFISLHFDVSQLSGSPTGSYAITGNTDGYPFSLQGAAHTGYSSANPSSLAGYYTMLMPAVIPTSASVPSGTGFATLNVTKAGRVRIAGQLADGATLSEGTYLIGAAPNAPNQFSMESSLPYVNKGSLKGAISFEDVPATSDFAGSLVWAKPPQAGGRSYPNGFTAKLSAIGSRYAGPRARAAALDVQASTPNASLELNEPDFTAEIMKQLTIGRPGHPDVVSIDNRDADKLTVKINATAGTIGGSFVHPVTGKRTKLQGALLYKQRKAGGFFLGDAQSGSILLDAD